MTTNYIIYLLDRERTTATGSASSTLHLLHLVCVCVCVAHTLCAFIAFIELQKHSN